MSGQLRLEITHLARGNIDDFWTIKSNNFDRATMHSSSASMIKKVLLKLGSYKMLVKISDIAIQAFVSSKRDLLA
jgi:hypothetical protein